MASRILTGLILSFTLSLSSWADVVTLKPSHPDRHVVVKGDTLWDISAKFLKDPWHWPNIWRHNPQIKNPHLIYPGDIITLCFVDNKPMLCVNEDRTLYPHIRTEEGKQAIDMIPLAAIAPFLTSPKVVNKDELKSAPYIVDFADEHLIAGAGTKVYVRKILQPDFLAYTTYRPGKTYQDPDTREILGYEAEYIADNVMLSLGDPATLRITSTKSEVRRGDRVMPTSEADTAFNFFPQPPAEEIHGAIIGVLNGVQEIGQYDVVVLSKGEQDGLKKGHILTVVQKGKRVSDPFHINKNELVQLPNQEAGSILVFRTFERVSYALVMHATRNMRVLDLVQTPEK